MPEPSDVGKSSLLTSSAYVFLSRTRRAVALLVGPAYARERPSCEADSRHCLLLLQALALSCGSLVAVPRWASRPSTLTGVATLEPWLSWCCSRQPFGACIGQAAEGVNVSSIFIRLSGAGRDCFGRP